ncbi:MAG: helix-turn-helix domain-containing protein [Gammaproteobacteria bacterium]
MELSAVAIREDKQGGSGGIGSIPPICCLLTTRRPPFMRSGFEKAPPLPDLSMRIMLRVLEEQGLAARPALEAAGFPEGLGQLPGEVSLQQELAFQEAFVGITGYRPDLWVQTGARYHLPSYGRLGMALMTSPDLGAMVSASTSTGELDYSLVELSPIEDGGLLSGQRLDFRRVPEPLVDFTTYRDLGAMLTALHDVWAGPFPLGSIELALPSPTPGEFTVMDHEVRFDAAATEVRWDRSYSSRRLYYGDPALHAAYMEECLQRIQMSTSGDDLLDALTEILVKQDGSPVTLSSFAAETGHSERTLQRRLLEHGARFRDLLEEARRRVASDLLTATDTPIAEIAWRLGYSEPTSFNHAFRRWTGVSPTIMRQRRGKV